MIRVDAICVSTQPLDLRVGLEAALTRRFWSLVEAAQKDHQFWGDRSGSPQQSSNFSPKPITTSSLKKLTSTQFSHRYFLE